VVFHYGWSAYWDNPSRYNDARVGVGENEGSPGIGPEVARWLVARKVSMVGADSCSGIKGREIRKAAGKFRRSDEVLGNEWRWRSRRMWASHCSHRNLSEEVTLWSAAA